MKLDISIDQKYIFIRYLHILCTQIEKVHMNEKYLDWYIHMNEKILNIHMNEMIIDEI